MSLRQSFYRLTHWETWDYRIKLIPLLPVWCWHCLRSGSWWFFTTANPTLTFGGFQGEGKREMYDQLPSGTYPKTLYVTPSQAWPEVEQRVTAEQYTYPLAVKPDVGMMGLLFQKVNTPGELRQYHETMPVDYLIQAFVSYPIEVSVFYYRFPNEPRGTITGFVRKEFLDVVGDGQSTLWDLMRRYELLKVFDELSHHSGHFYFGRYDVKCQSIADLKRGQNFSIIEFNGAGAAPHHVYGNGHSLGQAYRIILHHWNVLYLIAKQNRQNGHAYWTFRRGWAFLKESERHVQRLRRLNKQPVAVPNLDT